MKQLSFLLFFALITFGLPAQYDFTCSIEDIEGEIGMGGARISWSYSNKKPVFGIREVSDSTVVLVDTLGEVLLPDTLVFFAKKLDGNTVAKNTAGKWAVINDQAEPLIDFFYDDLSYEAIAPAITALVRLGDKWGFVNAEEGILLPVEFDRIRMLSPHVAFVVKGEEQALFLTSSRKLVPLAGRCATVPSFLRKTNYCLVRDTTGNLGILDGEGKYLVDARYSKIRPITRKLLKEKDPARKLFLVEKDGRSGVVAQYGTGVIPVVFQRIREMGKLLQLEYNRNEICRIFNGDSISQEYFTGGKMVITKDSLGLVRQNNRMGLFDFSRMTFIHPPRYEELAWQGDKQLHARQNGKYGLISHPSGQTLVDFVYDEKLNYLRSGLSSTKYLVQVRQGQLVGFLDPSDNFKVVLPPAYHFVRAFAEGRARVSKDGKWGYLDEEFRLAIPLRYDYATAFKNGQAEVVLGAKRFFIDTTGNCVKGCE